MKFIILILLFITSLSAHTQRYDASMDMMKAITLQNDSSSITLQKTLPKTVSNGNVITTEHFKIFYGDLIPSVSELWTDLDKNSYADYLDILKVELEYIWDKEVTQMGFKQPDFDGYIDVYVANTGLILDANTLTLSTGYLGYSVYDEATGETYMVMNGGMGSYSDYLTGIKISAKNNLKSTLAHEFFHLVQYAYAHGTEDFYDKNMWLYEGSAVWMEYQVYPDISAYLIYNDIYNLLRDGLIKFNIDVYSANNLLDFLVKKTNDTTFVRKIWEDFETSSDSIQTMLNVLDLYNKDFYEEYIDFAKNLIEKDTTSFTNGKLLFSYIGESSISNTLTCNDIKSKYTGYYSVLLFDDDNVYDDCNVFDLDTNSKVLNVSDGNDTLNGVKFNLKTNANGVVIIPGSNVTKNSNFYVNLKMIENKQNEVFEGWTLLGSTSDITLNNVESSINAIWTYESDSWNLYSKVSDNYGLPKLESIKAGTGFWVNSSSYLSSPFSNSFDRSQVCDFELNSGWSLVANKCLSSYSVADAVAKYSPKSIWKYDQGNWKLYFNGEDDGVNYGFETFSSIDSKEGYWFYKE